MTTLKVPEMNIVYQYLVPIHPFNACQDMFTSPFVYVYVFLRDGLVKSCKEQVTRVS